MRMPQGTQAAGVQASGAQARVSETAGHWAEMLMVF